MKTIKESYQGYFELNKSKFYSYLYPLNDVVEFKDILSRIKKEHNKAKHVVYAYKVNNSMKSCDDQEPKGTAGRPLLELLLKRELNNVALIVVRYFGGTKLGASRLLRSYVSSGNIAINNANLIDQ